MTTSEEKLLKSGIAILFIDGVSHLEEFSRLQLDRWARNLGLSAELYVFLSITESDNVDK